MSEPSPANKCPNCGAVMPANAPEGLCPKCLLLGVAAPTETGSGQARPAAPALDAVAAAFPQLEILELIGQGGMGCVFKARQPQLNRFVALKILPEALARDAAFAARFAREAQALAALSHPNIVTVHDFGQSGGFFYLLMEFVDGANLRQALGAGRFTPEQALAIVPPICDALQFAHDHGIVHCDIKPENVLLDKAGRVKIADFGIARMVGAAPLAADDRAAGTPHYMAPEQVEKPQAVDHRADIYSLGVVFYEMLTGELPLGKFAPPSRRVQVDVRLDEVVLHALEKEPERRYQQASQVKTDVETIASGIPASDPQESKRRREESRPPSGGWRTWVPFQLPEVKEIYAHMTDAEKREDLKLQVVGVLGTALASLALVFLHDLLPEGHQASTHLGILLVITLVLYIWIAVSIGKSKDFLCSTAWARKQGFTPDQIKLFSFGRRNVWTGIGVLIVVLLAIVVPNFVKARRPQQPTNTQQPANAVGTGAQPMLSFGPVIERVMRNNTETDVCLIDLDRNRVFAPDGSKGGGGAALRSARQAWNKVFARGGLEGDAWLAWRDQQGIDAVAMTQEPGEIRGLLGFEMRVVPVGPDSWDNITPAAFATQLSSVQPLPEAVLRGENALPATFLFKTREGGTGILQITGFADDPRAVKFRYKMIQEHSQNPVSRPVFNDVIERVLKAKDECFLDLDTGQTHDPVIIGGESDLPQSMDLSILYTEVEGSGRADSVVGLDHLDVLPTTSADWDITPDDLGKRMKAFDSRVVGGSTKATELANRQSELPRTYLFRTLKGNEGMLQIVAFTSDPAGVKLRYKLVENAAGTAAIQGRTVDSLPPVVVRTEPASAARDVAPGIVEVRVKFSKEMTAGSWSWTTAWADSTPEIVDEPRYDQDQRTCVIKVNLEPARTYAWWLNSEKFQNFRDMDGNPAVPYLLIFRTRDKEGSP